MVSEAFWKKAHRGGLGALLWLAALTIMSGVRVSAMEKGIQAGWVVDDADTLLLTPAVARQMRESGARWVRLNFRLNPRHLTWDAALLRLYGQAIANTQREHLNVLGLLSNESWPGSQADWIANSREVAGGNGDNPYLRALTGQGFHTLLRRFPSVRHWEIWNEPNAWTTSAPGSAEKLPGGSFLYPSNFAWLLRHASEESRALSHPVTLISGGVLSADFTGNLDADIATPYLRDTARAGKAVAGWESLPRRSGVWPVKGWGFHLYTKAGSRITPDDVAPYVSAFARLRDALEGGKAAKPVWITEIGWATPPKPGSLSEADQAANVTTALDTLRRLPSVGPVLWYKLQDEPAADLY
ncbi:MAG TPA: hypothetical protein VFB21_12780, partial [Chthonomonadaceae bacterium]|nr:hypothetical protein [Chthonomonadaceae bacterium]